MRIIIAGDGKVGTLITKQLSLEGFDLTLIDINPRVLEKIEERYDIMCVQGNCASMDILISAGVKEADLLIATTNADEVNLLCCMTAHGLNNKIHTIARIRNPEYAEQIYKMNDVFALSMAINPEKQTASEIEKLIKYPGFLKRDSFARGRVEIVELRIASTSPLCDKALSEFSSISKCKALVCAVLRDGTAIIPSGNFVLHAGDKIFVTANTEELRKLLKSEGIITHKSKSVLICGGGRISYYLAQLLQKSGIKVKIIENDYQRCLDLANLLPKATIIHGDASSEDVLMQEEISNYDTIVTATGVDELNMVVSMFAKIHHVPQIITKLGHVDNSTMLNELSLGSIVSPKEISCSNIVRYVRALKNQTGAAISVHKIADGQVEALEFRANSSTKFLNIPLKKLQTKDNVLIACIYDGMNYTLPNGDSCIKENDTVIIVAQSDQVIHQLNDIFE